MPISDPSTFFFFSSRRRHTRSLRDWSSDVCSSDLEAVLIEHIARSADPAVAYAHSVLESGASVAEASSRVGLLPKTFVRRFREQVGLAPKQLSRVRRLQRILASIHRPADVDWCQVAAQHGYTDQAHLIHDFRDLTGVTPTAYRPSSPQRRNHVPLSPVA